jgi:hypothetical protein
MASMDYGIDGLWHRWNHVIDGPWHRWTMASSRSSVDAAEAQHRLKTWHRLLIASMDHDIDRSSHRWIVASIPRHLDANRCIDGIEPLIRRCHDRPKPGID